jgi:hypothetical protein
MLMSENVKELRVEIKSYLGSERAYWHGNSLRVAFPVDLVEKLGLTRRKGKLFLDAGEKRKFLFFETDKGILLKVVDESTERKLKDALGFMDISHLSDEDLKRVFG